VDLLEALYESEAASAGLDLGRLRFVRWCLTREQGVAPLAQRQISTVGSTVTDAGAMAPPPPRAGEGAGA
jgi:hypothetical protein